MTDKPYIKVTLDSELEEMLDRWKEFSGASYSNTVRIALKEYLGPRLANVPKQSRATSPTDDQETAKNDLVLHFREYLMGLWKKNGDDIQKTITDLKEHITKNQELITEAGFEPKVRTICGLVTQDDAASDQLKDYARWVNSKLKLKEKGTIDLLNKVTVYDSEGKAIPNFIKGLKKAWKN